MPKAEVLICLRPKDSLDKCRAGKHLYLLHMGGGFVGAHPHYTLCLPTMIHQGSQGSPNSDCVLGQGLGVSE